MWKPFELTERMAGVAEQEAIDIMHGTHGKALESLRALAKADMPGTDELVRWRVSKGLALGEVVELFDAAMEENPGIGSMIGADPIVHEALLDSGRMLSASPGDPLDEASQARACAQLKDPDAAVRLGAVYELERAIGDAGVTRLLVDQVVDDADDEVAIEALRLLARLRPRQAAEAVARLVTISPRSPRTGAAIGVFGNEFPLGLLPAFLVRAILSTHRIPDYVLAILCGEGFELVTRGCSTLLNMDQDRQLTALKMLAGISRYAANRDPPLASHLSRCIKLIKSPLREQSGVVRRQALRILHELDWQPVMHECHRVLTEKNVSDTLRDEVVRIIIERSEKTDLSKAEQLLQSLDPAVQRAAASNLVPKLERGRRIELLLKLLCDDDAEVATHALTKLQGELSPTKLRRMLVDRLPYIQPLAAEAACVKAFALSTNREEELEVMRAGASAGSSHAAEAICRRLAEWPHKPRFEIALELAHRVIEGPLRLGARWYRRQIARVHQRAQGGLGRISKPRYLESQPGQALITLLQLLWSRASQRPKVYPLAERCLRQMDVDVVGFVLKLLSKEASPYVDDLIFDCTRHPDAAVRMTALKIASEREDPRFYGAIVAGTTEQEPAIHLRCHEYLKNAEELPSAKHHPPINGEPAWSAMRKQMREAARWIRDAGQRLMGRSVDLRACQLELGSTYAVDGSEEIPIEVNFEPIACGHPQGLELVQALGLHELGHHYADFREPQLASVHHRAQREGIGGLLNLLLDERLERILRTVEPEWGRLFDRLVSYAFTQRIDRYTLTAYATAVGLSMAESRAGLAAGRLPGRLIEADPLTPRVEMRPIDLLRVPRLRSRDALFSACLRIGIDPEPFGDAAVTEALGLIPENLKDHDHEQMLLLTRRIADTLGGETERRRHREAWKQMLAQAAAERSELRRMVRRIKQIANPSLSDSGASEPDDEASAEEALKASDLKRARRFRPSRGHRGRRPRSSIEDAAEMRRFLLSQNRNVRFKAIEVAEPLPYDAAAHARIVATIRPHIRRLRSYLERLGRQEVEQHASKVGHRVDIPQARRAAVKPEVAVLVHSRDEILTDAHIGILIDRSGSMAGTKLEWAKAFAVLLAEAARGVRGLDGHLHAFDDEQLIPLGGFARPAIAPLKSNGGNNDAAALWQAGQVALASRKRHRLVVMISDGLPTECSVPALEDVVRRLTSEHHVVCAQVAVDRLGVECFPHFVDLSACGFDEAVGRFGRLLITLTKDWR